MIISDDITFKPILDFDAYSNAMVKMIKESHRKFSIGIYGEWQAYRLFSEGKSPVQVAIDLNIRASQAIIFQKEYWDLKALQQTVVNQQRLNN